MKFPSKFFLISSFLWSASYGAQENSSVPMQDERHYNVRVLLDQRNDFTDNPWRIVSDKDLVLIDPRDESKKIMAKSRELEVSVQGDFLYLNKHKFLRSQVLITPKEEGHLSLGGKKYQGSFLLVRYGTGALIINIVDLEDYVASVLGTESWPGWPVEVNKAFAIGCRSFVIHKVQEARRTKRLFDVKNTNADQTYTGLHARHNVHEAVKQTKGVFLAYKNKPIMAMYDICCGGVIPARIDGINGKAFPYLARKEQCTFCKGCKMYAWSAMVSAQLLEELLKAEFPELKKIAQINIIKKDPAGLVKLIEFKERGTAHLLTGKELSSMLSKKIKSRSYTIAKNGAHFVFEGRGYGHHTGLCQWGARQMVRKGYDYREILAFYYPGTSLVKLS